MATNRKALLEFFIKDKEFYTFIIRPKDKKLGISDNEPIVIKAEISETEVNEITEKIKSDFISIGNPGMNKYKNKSLDQFCMESFYQLGQKIFTPKLMSYISKFKILYLVPFGPLHYLPLHAMRFEGKDLIDLFQIAYLPSASILQYIQRSNIADHKNILLCGVDSTKENNSFVWETDQINERPYWDSGDSVYLRKAEATPTNFIEHCANKKVIHISSHGHFSTEDALFSGVALYGNYSSQYINGKGIQEEDYKNLLTAKDIFENLKIDAELFVVSGCVTGDSEYKTGDELIGLTRAILYAGASSLIVTLFPTFKELTGGRLAPQLEFGSFYDYWIQNNLSKSEAFQKFIQGIKSIPEYAHPYNWMSYILVGNVN